MTSAVLSPAGVAILFAHLLLVATALVFKGIGLQQRSFTRRLAFGLVSLALWLTAFYFAFDWLERGMLLFAGLCLAPWLLGLVFIREDRVGVVIKKFARRTLPPGQFIALDGEAGYQADTLPPGLHFGYWFWQFSVIATE